MIYFIHSIPDVILHERWNLLNKFPIWFTGHYMVIIIIIIIIIKERTCTLIDVAIPADRNVVQKEAEKKLNYKSLSTEIQRMWDLKCTIIPVIIGATGIVMRSLRKNLEAVPGKHSIDSLQKQLYLEHHT